ncbi:MAG: AAA family ATPase [Clostridia bacterium]|nr:AAA family ATPase [Clostridia bacterium]
MKIWGSNVLYSPDYHTLLLDAIGLSYTTEQIVTAMGCCGDDERILAVPSFFEELIVKDNTNYTLLSSEFIEKFNNLLVASAMINGDFTLVEAKALSSIISGLHKRAEYVGVKMNALPDNNLKITERKEDSYLQNNRLIEEEAKREKNKSKDESASNDSGRITIPVVLKFNVSSDDSTGNPSHETNTQNADGDHSASNKMSDENESFESLLAKLDNLVGLDDVKRDVHSLMNFIKVIRIRQQRGMQVPTISYHLVFTGNPGTGKTTVARLVARLYYHMGILPQGQLVETDRSALVAGYLGQTAIKTQKVISEAMGGVLFIDEAYSLAGGREDIYGKEAIETILKAMEDHRDELVVIVAGYTELMHNFIESNPGLSSRFSKYFEFPDYTGDEMIAIFERFCAQNGYSVADDTVELLRNIFNRMYENRDEHFGNARTVRNIFEKSINAQADRIAALSHLSDSDLELISTEDIIKAVGGDLH